MKTQRNRTIAIAVCVLCVAVVLFCAVWWLIGHVKAVQQVAERQKLYSRLGIVAEGKQEFIPLPDSLTHHALAARLGQSLFADRRIARNQYRVCGACHKLNEGGIDARALGGILPRTAYNAALADVFLHDGSVTGMPALVRHMIESPNFCAGGTVSDVAKRLAADEQTRKRFQNVYPDGVTADNVVDAIVQYQRTLFTSHQKFDLWCAGRTNILNSAQKRGFDVFRRQKCTDCHYGPALGTLKMFDGNKVPCLRGLGQRSAYLPDATKDLKTVIRRMPSDELNDENSNALEAFLKIL